MSISSRPILTVSQLTAEIKTLLERNFEHLWVEGEVSNLRLPGSGHLYFTLKDESAQIRAVMFRMQNRLLKFQPEDGLQVVGYGRLTVYEPRGEYQIVLDYLEPKGLGALQLAFEQLKEKLSREGLFDPARKKPLPPLPQKIGIVTSPTGAAIRDILQIIDRRFANVHILLYPVRVQGAGAAQEIARAIDELGQWPGLDVMIVGRGGGSLEDLWAFNEEPVARAIHRSPVPVVSAVGHEIDFTIADFVADLRAPTPSAAAELVVRNKVELVQTLESLVRRLSQTVRMNLESRKERLSSLVYRLTDPRKRVSDQRLHLDDLSSRLATSIQQSLGRRIDRFRMKVEGLTLLHPGKRVTDYSHRLSQIHRRLAVAGRSSMRFYRQRVEVAAGRLQSLSPLAVLERGYGIARVLPSREIIRDASRLRVDDRVNVKVHRGEFVARVEKMSGAEEDPQLFVHTFKESDKCR
ncbi:MAG: exodeoxyribonuclease VII large subunit [Deltaproteobacteria bacterium]|nr:exodeoxyribonuclease VII large subunit [Deltaproteobacteria bacterium]